MASSGGGGGGSTEDSLMKVTVKFCDMSPAAVSLAVQIALDAVHLVGTANHREIARMLKEEFDKMLKPAWQCIVGNRFGSFITHAQGTFVYFMVGELAILLFRTIPAAASKTKH
jgi:dynein light chain LC8-type